MGRLEIIFIALAILAAVFRPFHVITTAIAYFIVRSFVDHLNESAQQRDRYKDGRQGRI